MTGPSLPDSQLFAALRDGERVRCGVITGPGGHGKTHYAERLASGLADTGVSALLLHGDLVTDDVDLDNADVIVLDVADAAPATLLKQLRADAQSATSRRSLVLFARSLSNSAELAELAALADRDGRLGVLAPLSLPEVAEVIPKGLALEPQTLADATGSIPIHVDRLRAAWDEDGWPTSDHIETIPDRFVRHVGVQASRLSPEDRVLLGTMSITQLPSSGSADPVGLAVLTDAGLITADGRVPESIARSIPDVLTDHERDVSIRAAGAELLHADPARAAAVAESAGEAPPWAAIAMAAAGRFDDATRMLELTSDEHDGSALAAAAHVAAAESRWSDAARYATAITDHPYWSEARTSAVSGLYEVLGGRIPSRASRSTSAVADPGAHFIDEAVGTVASTFEPDADLADLGERLRAVVRQASNQQPMLDIAVSPAEVAAVAALLIGEFEVARALIEQSPEVAERSELNEAFDSWVSVRSGVLAAVEDASTPQESETQMRASEVLRLAARLMTTRRDTDLEKHAEVLEEIRAVGSALSVDVLTFDALCELHLGAQRLDARREAREIAAGIDGLVAQLGHPTLWDVRRLWNRVEAAIAAGDAAALAAASGALSEAATDGPGVRLATAAQQWVRVFAGQIDKTSLEDCLDALESHGYVWEAAALAGQAAIRTSNAELARALLQRGRTYRQAAPEAKITSPAGLSEREIEIGQLVLAGHSYKEIGAMCFISPKTVEHHIAHIRQKLAVVGVSRAEFRAALQADLSTS